MNEIDTTWIILYSLSKKIVMSYEGQWKYFSSNVIHTLFLEVSSVLPNTGSWSFTHYFYFERQYFSRFICSNHNPVEVIFFFTVYHSHVYFMKPHTKQTIELKFSNREGQATTLPFPIRQTMTNIYSEMWRCSIMLTYEIRR